MHTTFNGIKFTDADVINRDEYIPKGDYNPHGIHPYLLHDHGFCLAVVFASCLQDALDIAADEDKLDLYRVCEEDLGDYGDGEGLAYLGNASEAYDIEGPMVEELPNPPFSFVALFNAQK